MAQMFMASIFLVVLLTITNASQAFANTLDGLRVDLNHIHPQGKFTKLQHHVRAARQSRRHLAAVLAKQSPSSRSTNVATQLQAYHGDMMYQMELAIGTPPVPLTAYVDTTDDLTWTQCNPCTQSLNQPARLYDPSKSSTFSKIPCNTSLCQALYSPTCNPDCMYSGYYGGITEGILARETLTLGAVGVKQVTFPGVGFGCSNLSQTTNIAGIVGLNRGPLSLISQLSLSKFSYCLTPFGKSKSSPLLLGSLATLNGSASIPLLNSACDFYTLAWEGMTVGDMRLPIPDRVFEVDADGFGGLVVDTSSPYGFLSKPAFELVKQEFIAFLKLPIVDPLLTDSELCFLLPPNSSVEVPKLIYHFHGADLELPVNNYMIHDPKTGFLCFTILENECYKSLGNFQLQNMHVAFDLIGDKASISPAQCDRF